MAVKKINKKNKDSGDQNTPESTAREMKRLKKGGSGIP